MECLNKSLPKLLQRTLIAVFFIASVASPGRADESAAKEDVTGKVLELTTRLQQLDSELTDVAADQKPDSQILKDFQSAKQFLKEFTPGSKKPDAEELTNKLKEKAEELQQPPEPESIDTESMSDADLAASLAADRARIASLKVQLRSETEIAELPPAQRTDSLRAAQRELEEKLQRANEQPPASGGQASLASRIEAFSRDIRILQWKTDLAGVTEQIFAIETEAALKLPTLRMNSTTRRITQLEQRIESIQNEIASRAQSESQDYASDADEIQELLLSIPSASSITSFAAHKDQTTKNRELVGQTIPQNEAQLKSQTELLRRLTAQDGALRRGVSRFGTGGEIGKALRQFSRQFPNESLILEQVETNESVTTTSYIQHAQLTSDIAVLDSFAERTKLNAAQDTALQTHRELLVALRSNYTRHSTVIAELQTANHEILSLLEKWHDFANENLLWLPSHSPLTLSVLGEVGSDFRAVAHDVNNAFSAAVSRDMTSTWAMVLPLLIVCGIFLALQQRFRDQLHHLAIIARRGSCTKLSPTLRAIVLTFITAAEWPLIILLIGVVFRASGRTGAATAFGNALTSFGLLILWMNCVRHSLRPDGILETHFRWQETSCRILRKWFHRVMVASALLLFFFFVVHFCQTQSESAALERLVFVVVMIIVGIMLWRLMVPWSKPLVRMISQMFPMSRRLRWLWAALPVACPFFLAGLSAAGFHHTALQLNDRISWTVIAGSFVILLHQLMIRWLRVASTETRLQLVRQRIAEQAAEREAAEAEEVAETPAVSEVPTTPTEEEEMEFFGLQAHSLVRNAAILTLVGCMWGIWADVLPALRGINRYSPWSITEPATVTDADGNEVVEQVERPVTVGDLVFAGFIVVLTTVAVRQLPGVIEIVMQSRGFENGLRYAVSTVSRYAVLIIGTVSACHLIGLRWTQVQWLAAGLSVGLGFGLQEVFANFISGIIILVERPVRIGDIVTLDGVSGVVSRIRIRATSITDWDRREYIVPNREFVTGKLLNWTLSDTTNRVVVNVGIGYDCDTERARKIMLEVAADHPNVMKDPAPIATFEGFGDSALNLILRAYLPNLDNRLSTITELHAEIHRRFDAASIEIPFPQRDVNYKVRTPIPPERDV